MPQLERFDTDNTEQKHRSIIQAFEKGRAITRAEETGEINIIMGTSKQGISHIGIVVDARGRSLHLVNAVSDSKIPLKDVAKTLEYPDIIVSNRNFNPEAILKKFSEFLFFKFQLQDIKINAYKNTNAFKANKPFAMLDPNTGEIKTVA